MVVHVCVSLCVRVTLLVEIRVEKSLDPVAFVSLFETARKVKMVSSFWLRLGAVSSYRTTNERTTTDGFMGHADS